MSKRELYRDPKRGKIAGVCAGISDYFNMELWLVRIVFISAALLSGGWLPIVAYIAAWFILETKPVTQSSVNESTANEGVSEVKSKVWQKGQPPRKALQELKDYMNKLDGRIVRIEQHVTSPTFTVSREINKL